MASFVKQSKEKINRTMENRRTKKKAAREKREILRISKEDGEQFAKILAKAKQDHGIPKAPAMQCKMFAASAKECLGKPVRGRNLTQLSHLKMEKWKKNIKCIKGE